MTVAGFSLKREVSIGDLVAFASAALAVIFAYTALDKRLALAEADGREQKAATSHNRDEVREELKLINEKLDRLVERRLNR